MWAVAIFYALRSTFREARNGQEMRQVREAHGFSTVTRGSVSLPEDSITNFNSAAGQLWTASQQKTDSG